MNILIIKVGALGDVVRTSFIAQALKDKYIKNNPVVYWLTDKKAVPLFSNNPYVDFILPIEEKSKIEKKFFNLVIHLEEDEENCKFVSSLKKRRVIGFFYSDGKIVCTPSVKEWFNMSALGEKPQNDLFKKNNKKTHRQIMGEIVDVDWKRYAPFLRLTEKQRKIAETFLRRHSIKRSDLIIGVNTGAADRWPKSLSVDKTVQLINYLYKRFNAKILLFGGSNELVRNKEILQKSRAPVIDTGCGNDLIEFPAIISACNLFITSDSLGLHVALALKRKTICLIGPTSVAEIDMYSLGSKIAAKSNCLCCYKKTCLSMKKVDVKDILDAVKKLTESRVALVITAFNEPNIKRAVDATLTQKNVENYQIVVSAPDKKTLDMVKTYEKDKKIKIIKDPGKGKSFALNYLFDKIDTDILILTDGDVFLDKNAVKELLDLFDDPEIGCVSGRPTPIEDKNTKYGYWANFLFEAAHNLRAKAFRKNSFLECSGYLFAFRKKEVKSIPLDVAEDTFIPYLMWERGYKIGYAEKAKVFVKNATNWKDWLNQKIRTSKAHETLSKYVNTKITKRVKNFKTEAVGILQILRYPNDFKEFIWTMELIFSRLIMWGKVYYDVHLKQKHYSDAWQRVESTK